MLVTEFFMEHDDYETVKDACKSLGDECSEYNHKEKTFTITTVNANCLLWIGRLSIVKKIKSW